MERRRPLEIPLSGHPAARGEKAAPAAFFIENGAVALRVRNTAAQNSAAHTPNQVAFGVPLLMCAVIKLSRKGNVMKKKATLAILVFAAAAVSALPAAAQMKSGAESGFFAGGSLGHARAKDACNVLVDPACDDRDAAWRLIAGYQINRNFSVEGGYHSLGKARSSAAGADARANGWELLAVGAYPVSREFSVYGKLGIFHGQLKGGGALAGVNETNTDITFGLGVQFEAARNVALRGEWQHYPNLGGPAFGGDTDVDVWSVGAVFRFQ